MSSHGYFPTTRLRRLREHPQVRSLVQDTRLCRDDFIFPLFIHHGTNIKNPVASMPGQFQLSVDQLEDEIKSLVDVGIKSVLLFGVPETKDPYAEQHVVQAAIPVIKNIAPEMLVISDLCVCSYTEHGHCGEVVDQRIENDLSLELITQQAIHHARAGSDVIAPSGMMDGMIHAIRQGLDAAGFSRTPILSYAVKYHSSMYGPFRQATLGAPKFGDRRSYQMNYSNSTEALRECALDIQEGADMLMVKPAHTYLDIIYKVKQAHPLLALGAYHTSGEFAMLKAAIQNGWIDERGGTMEVLTAIKRAGADFIISYCAKDVASWL